MLCKMLDIGNEESTENDTCTSYGTKSGKDVSVRSSKRKSLIYKDLSKLSRPFETVQKVQNFILANVYSIKMKVKREPFDLLTFSGKQKKIFSQKMAYMA